MSIEQTATTRRVTRPRLLITQVPAELSRFATAQEITDILRERGTRIGTATAYRNVQMMASQGELDVIHVNGEALYRECSDQHHHHHIVCHECERTIEIEIPGLEQWIDKAAKQLKYQTIAHELEIFDLCPTVCGEACHRTASQRRHLTKGWTTDDARRYWPSALEQIMAQSRRYWPSASVPFQSLAQ